MALAIIALMIITLLVIGYLALEVQRLRASVKRQGELLQEEKAERVNNILKQNKHEQD